MTAIYQRFFRITSGPLIEAVRQCIRNANDATEKWKAIADELGAEQVRGYSDGRVAGFAFPKGVQPDPKIWRRNATGNWWPRKNTNAGKALAQRLSLLPKPGSEQDALRQVGLSNHPSLIEGGRGYTSVLFGFPAEGRIYVQVPWREIATAELDEYQRERAAGNRWSCELDHLSWKPTPDMVEIKEWECIKETEELRDSPRKAA